MRLELKDVESEMVYTIDEGGAVLGRERARTDINFRDESISKRHARIYPEEGVWYIEDLGSSNGTYVGGQRITDPTPLGPEASFALAQRRFEVVHHEGEVAPEAADPVGADEPALAGGWRAVLAAAPRALVVYATLIPTLALQPRRAIRRLVDEQALPALSRGELAAYALPAGVLLGLVGPLFGLLAGVFRGQVALDGLVRALPWAAAGGALAAVVGFLAHPALGWLVRVLRGSSTARGRSNATVGFFAFALLATVPGGLRILIGAVPVPLPGLAPVILSLLVTLLGVVLAHRWALAFGVMRGMRVFLVAVGVLAVLAGGAQAVRVVLEPPLPGDSALRAMEQKALARARAAEADEGRARTATDGAGLASLGGPGARGGAPGPGSPEAGEEPAVSDAASAGATSALLDRGADRASDRSADRASDRSADRAAGRSTDPAAGRSAPPDRAPPDAAGARVGSDAPPAPPSPDPLSAEHPRGSTPFARFRAQRAAIERALDDDPSLLDRRDVLEPYRSIWGTTAEIGARWRRAMRGKPRWEREKILERRRDLEIYRKTHVRVERLHRLLFER